MEPVVIGKTLFREIQVVNGNVVRDVELVSEADSTPFNLSNADY